MQFQPGQSGNPAGRPRGARNKATVILQALLQDNVEEIGDRLVRRAKLGDLVAIRLCVDRILPRRRDAPIPFELPPIDEAADLPKAYEALRAGLASGEISAREAFELGRFAERMAASLQAAELAERVAKLEAALAAVTANAGEPGVGEAKRAEPAGAMPAPSPDDGVIRSRRSGRVGNGEDAVAHPTDAAGGAPVKNRDNTGSASAGAQCNAPLATHAGSPGAARRVGKAERAHHTGATSATVEVRVGNGEEAVAHPTADATRAGRTPAREAAASPPPQAVPSTKRPKSGEGRRARSTGAKQTLPE